MVASAFPQPIRIVIADNRPIFRDGLRQLLETQPYLRIVGETGNGAEAAAMVCERAAHVLLLDFVPQSTFAALAALRDACAAARTIILAEGVVEGADLAKAIQLGARGVVLKDSPAEVLFTSIRAVLAGKYWIGCEEAPDESSGLRKLEAELRQRRAFGLTPRELEIVRMVVGGYTNREIAEKLSIGENTVKSHLTHIFNKLGASSRTELALFATHHRLLNGV